jgi:hypothetical protein
MVITGASLIRTASNSLKVVFGTLPELKNYKAPSFTAIKRWVQKVGYYKLMLPKIIAEDWMIIIDATIQMGEKKCVVVLGCRQSVFPTDRALKLEDLEVLSLRIASSLNSRVITQMLNEVSSVVGRLICICSDRGSEIVRGIKDFQVNHPETRHIGDTAHRVANLLEATLEHSKRWKEFREQVTQTRRRMQNSKLPGLLPPSPRTKARYMNVDSLITWAADVLLLIDSPGSLPELEMEELKKYAGWLLSYREDVGYWNRIISIGIVARDHVREGGIHASITDSFEQSISCIKMGFRELRFADEIAIFLLEQSKGLNPGKRFLGSSEVLETLFGKLKYMEHEQTVFGFTSLVIAAMAHVGPIENEIIEQAIKSVKLSDIDEWSAKEIGRSVQSERKQVKKIIAILKEKMGQEISGELEGEAVGF